MRNSSALVQLTKTSFPSASRKRTKYYLDEVNSLTFASLEFAMLRCEEHLDATSMRSTEIESYFVQYLLIRICAEYETRVTTLVYRRCSRTKDLHLKSFAQQTAEYICKR